MSFDRRPVNPKAGLQSRKSSRGQTPTGTSNWALWKTHNACCLYCVTRAKLFFFSHLAHKLFLQSSLLLLKAYFSSSGAGRRILLSLQTHRSPNKKQFKGVLSVSAHRKVKYIILTRNSQQERLKLEADRWGDMKTVSIFVNYIWNNSFFSFFIFFLVFLLFWRCTWKIDYLWIIFIRR